MTYTDKQGVIHEIVAISHTASPHMFRCATHRGQCLIIPGNEIHLKFGEVLPQHMAPDLWLDIVQFHHHRGQIYQGPPRDLPHDLQLERISRSGEEFAELLASYCAKDRREILDGWVDSVYYAIGTCYLHGFHFPEAWRRVHAANMAKLSIKEANGGPTKPPGWKPPTFDDLVK